MILFRPYAGYHAHPMYWESRPGVMEIQVKCETLWDYCNSLAKIWPINDNLMIVEHDIDFTQDLFDELADCPAALCVPMYKLYPATTGLSNEVWAHRREGNPFLEFISEYQEWVPYAGLGMAKINTMVRHILNDPPINVHWKELDTAISQYFYSHNMMWHVHRTEARHLHVQERLFSNIDI